MKFKLLLTLAAAIALLAGTPDLTQPQPPAAKPDDGIHAAITAPVKTRADFMRWLCASGVGKCKDI